LPLLLLQFASTPTESTFQVIFTTNVAETSITIPGVRYIVDCGLAKVKKFDAVRRISVVDLDLITKVSAEQRAGRAGRTAPGLLNIMS
uniref:Helicase C-terminal domain-containing protein n=1 Tax=Gongylonema pulchrum TaxID=637853 RepID=A0A183DH61_9BILA